MKNYVVIKNVLSNDICNELIKSGEKNLKTATVVGRKIKPHLRDSNTSFLNFDWPIMQSTNNIVIPIIHNIIKEQNWNIEINKTYPYRAAQYTSYNVGGHYKWHSDVISAEKHRDNETMLKRAVSVTILLSEPNKDFVGGEFEIKNHYEKYCNKVNELTNVGDMVVFKSFSQHRVNAIESGCRKSLVIWFLSNEDTVNNMVRFNNDLIPKIYR